MNVRPLVTAATLLLLVSPPALAQPPGGARGPGGGMMMMAAARNPVAYLLEKGEELQLTDEQTVAMKVLADSLDVLNEPDLEKVEAVRGSGDRTAMRGLRTVMMSLRERNEGFVERARALLTEEQRPTAEKLLEEIAPRRRPGVGQGARRGGPGGGSGGGPGGGSGGDPGGRS